MAAKVSQLFHDFKSYAAEKWDRFVTYFANRKVTKLESAEKKLPDLFAEPSTPCKPLSGRASKVSESVAPVVKQSKPSSVCLEEQQRLLLADYNPQGIIFQQALRQARISPDQPLDTDIQADYADAIRAHFPLNPGDDLEQILEDELFRLIQVIKSSKAKASQTPPSTPFSTPPQSPIPVVPPVIESQHSTVDDWERFGSEETVIPRQLSEPEHFLFDEELPSTPTLQSSPVPAETMAIQPQQSLEDDWVDVQPQTSIQPSQPKAIEKKQLAKGEVEYYPFDRELPAPIAGINWLHRNRYYNRIDFDDVADEMIRQSGEAVGQYHGKSRHVASTTQLYCMDRDWRGLMKYAHNLRDNQVVPFDPQIMAEINIRLFQDSLIRALEFSASRHPERAEAYREAISFAAIPDWNSLATNFMVRTIEFGSDYVPSYCFEQLERVIPEYKVPRPAPLASTVSSEQGEQVSYESPVADFRAFGRNIPAHITVADVAKKVIRPNVMGGDARAAFRRIELGVENDEFYSVAEGMTYLAEDQGQPVTDPATYRSVRFRMIKERAVTRLAEKISRETSPDMKAQLQKALTLVELNAWSRLGESDRAYQKHTGTGLFDSYLLGEIRQYRRLKVS